MFIFHVWVFVLAIVLTIIPKSSQLCDTKSCDALSKDVANRMWNMEELRERVFTVYARQVTRTRHYQLALWHLSIAGDLQCGKTNSHSMSNLTGFIEPDITQVYRKEIEKVVGNYVLEKQNDSLAELEIEDSEAIMDKLWAQICGEKLSITQNLVAAILRRQKTKLKLDVQVTGQLDILVSKLHKNEIPQEKWNDIVTLTGHTLCDSDVCPWLHRTVDLIENYFIENAKETNYLERVAHLVKGYCRKQGYAVLDELIGHHHGKVCEEDSASGDSKDSGLLLPKPSQQIDKSLLKNPGKVVMSVSSSNPHHKEVERLIEILNEVPLEDLEAKFGNLNATNLDLFLYLINHDAVKNKFEDDKALADFAKAYELLLKSAKTNTDKFDDLSHLVKYFPTAENEEQTQNLEELKKLLSDPEQLQSLFGDNPGFDDVPERHVLEKVIKHLLSNPDKTKYHFTDALYDILERVVIEDKEEYIINMNGEGISPLDTLIVEVDPSRLDRKPRFAAPGGYYSEEVDRPSSNYSLHYTLPSPILTTTEYDHAHLEDLIPRLNKSNGLKEYKLFESCRILLADASNREKILGPNFDFSQYPTKISLLEYVFKRLNQLHDNNEITVDPVVNEFMYLYYHILEFTNQEIGISPTAVMRINYGALILLLPVPKTDDEEYKYESIQSFLLDDDHLDYVMRDLDRRKAYSQGELMKLILERCLNFVDDEPTRHACAFYLEHIPDTDAADKPIEKYVVYKKSKLDEIDTVYVQLNPSMPSEKKVTSEMQPPSDGILQIPVANPNSGIDDIDIQHPSRMIPDIDPTSDMYYNISNLKWQIRRDDMAANLFEEEFDWNHYSTKIAAIEEIINRIIALGYSEEIYVQPRSLKYAEIYLLALKALQGEVKENAHYDYTKLLDATISLTKDKEFIEDCNYLKTIFNDKETMKKILGPDFHPDIYKNDITLLRAVLYRIVDSEDEDMAKAHYVSNHVQDFLKQLGAGYNIQLIGSTEHQEIDISECMQAAFDRNALSDELKAKYKHLLDFMIDEMDADKHLGDFDFTEYNTKGELVAGLLKTLLTQNNLPEDILKAAAELIPLVRFTGPGGEPFKQS